MTTRDLLEPHDRLQPELLDRLWDRLDGPARVALTALAEAAASRDLALFAVGGAVRDLLRTPEGGATIGDLDLAVEGDPAPLLDDLARDAALPPTRHDRFGTATLRIRVSPVDLVRIDLARTRRERYPRPGALPVVAPATIAEDLARRDFSVNAMALGIGGGRRGALLDPFGGRRDLERGLIRALHDRCFRDDPTRLIRACRYAARLDARFAPGTGAQARASAPSLRTIGADRFGEAWRRLLLDAAAPRALARAAALRLPQARVAGWSPPPRLVAAFGALTRATPPGDAAAVFWALTGLTAPPAVVRALPGACALTREERRALQDGAALRGAARRAGPGRPARQRGRGATARAGSDRAARGGVALARARRGAGRARGDGVGGRRIAAGRGGAGRARRAGRARDRALAVDPARRRHRWGAGAGARRRRARPPPRAGGAATLATARRRTDVAAKRGPGRTPSRVTTPGGEQPRDPQATPAATGGGALFSVGRGERPDCTVCAAPVESGASAFCSECAEPFHLVLTNEAATGDGSSGDVAGKNCGEVWLNEDFLALEFGCARCLAVARGAPPPPAAPPPGDDATHRATRGASRSPAASPAAARSGARASARATSCAAGGADAAPATTAAAARPHDIGRTAPGGGCGGRRSAAQRNRGAALVAADGRGRSGVLGRAVAGRDAVLRRDHGLRRAAGRRGRPGPGWVAAVVEPLAPAAPAPPRVASGRGDQRRVGARRSRPLSARCIHVPSRGLGQSESDTGR